MSIEQLAGVLTGALSFLIVSSVAVEARRRADEAFAPVPVAAPLQLPHHAMPWGADHLPILRRRAWLALVALATVINNASAPLPMRGTA